LLLGLDDVEEDGLFVGLVAHADELVYVFGFQKGLDLVPFALVVVAHAGFVVEGQLAQEENLGLFGKDYYGEVEWGVVDPVMRQLFYREEGVYYALFVLFYDVDFYGLFVELADDEILAFEQAAVDLWADFGVATEADK
jgi:hypothetical protein